MKTSNKLALAAVPVVLAVSALTATGVFAKSTTNQALAAVPAAATTPSTQTNRPSDAAEPAGTETADAAEPAGTGAAAESTAPETDAAGGHADNPNDPNADHQFNGEE